MRRIRQLNAQRRRIFVHGFNEARRQFTDIFFVLVGAVNDLVVDVRDVAYVRYIVSTGTKITHHHIEYDHGARMSEVRIIVYRQSADIHSHFTGFKRFKRFFLARDAVVDR